jgi:hypothetical protein
VRCAGDDHDRLSLSHTIFPRRSYWVPPSFRRLVQVAPERPAYPCLSVHPSIYPLILSSPWDLASFVGEAVPSASTIVGLVAVGLLVGTMESGTSPRALIRHTLLLLLLLLSRVALSHWSAMPLDSSSSSLQQMAARLLFFGHDDFLSLWCSLHELYRHRVLLLSANYRD